MISSLNNRREIVQQQILNVQRSMSLPLRATINLRSKMIIESEMTVFWRRVARSSGEVAQHILDCLSEEI